MYSLKKESIFVPLSIFTLSIIVIHKIFLELSKDLGLDYLTVSGAVFLIFAFVFGIFYKDTI